MKTLSAFLLTVLFCASLNAQQPISSHPEKGILPFNAPCKDCMEEIEKRTATTREFFALNADGSKTIYKQQSLGNMNFKDANGYWRTKDPRVIKESEKVFAARMQPSPVVIDFENKFASITNGEKEFRFNKNISLVHIAANGNETSFGEGNWNNVTRSENFIETIFLVQDFYPGIDLQMITNAGRVETNFILKNKLELTDGSLVMRQQLEVPAGLSIDLSASNLINDKMHSGTIAIRSSSMAEYFSFLKSYAHDANTADEKFTEMPFVVNANQLDYFVPVSWLNQTSLQYPVTLDPFVQSSDTLDQALILGSGFTQAPACDTGGCNYFLNIMTPPNCQITDINCYFSYLANLPCIRDDGGFSITMTNPNGDSCTTRNFVCLGGIQGACFFWPVALMNAVPPLSSCLLPPQCTSYPLNFRLQFRRCNNIPVVYCDATCILANSDCIMTIIGRTVEITNVFASPQTICEGQCTNLAATADWGVPLFQNTNNYTFTWQPGNLVGDSIIVCPTTTTHYQVTVTDLCGVTDTGSIDVIVVPFQNPGFTISPNDTVCDSDAMTFTANGSAPATSYDWIINCPVTQSFFDQQILNYSAPAAAANCTATLVYQVVNGPLTCNFSHTQPFNVELCSGINEFEDSDPVSSIFPNPTNDKVTIAFSQSHDAKHILLSNVLGEMQLEEKNFSGEKFTLDVSPLSKGIYFVKVLEGEKMSIHKIILY